MDNFYLQLGAEGGLLLFASSCGSFCGRPRAWSRAHGQSDDPFLRALTAGAFGAFVAVAVANVTASVWETLVVGVGFWFLAGLATSAVLHAEAPEASGRLDGRAARRGPAAPAVGAGEALVRATARAPCDRGR